MTTICSHKFTETGDNKMVQHEGHNWVQEQYREQTAQKNCNVDTAYEALYQRVCFDIDQANVAIGALGYYKVNRDTDHSFQVMAGHETIRAVFAKQSTHVRGVTLKPMSIVGHGEAEASYEAQPMLNDSLECMLNLSGELLTTGQFSQRVLSSVFR